MSEEKNDVFLSHTSDDKPAVEELAEQLMDEGIWPWLDSWNLIPGEPWQEEIEEALDSCPVCAVFLGPSGLGTWHNEQMRVAIERRVTDRSRRYRVIPVLLPGAESADRRTLPSFLRRYTWVDFRQGLDDGHTFSRLVAGIRGKPPGPPSRRRGKKRVTPPAPSPSVPSYAQPSVRSYRNFDLRLALGERNQLLVEVLNAPAGEAMGRAFISETIDWDLEDQLRPLSQELGSLLMPGEVRHCFEASLAIVNQNHEGLRLRLRMIDQALAMIPWEAARIGEEYLNLQPQTPIVRYLYASNPPTPLVVDGPLQVVGLISNPQDLPPLSVNLERTRLEEALQPLIKQGRLNLTWLPRADTQLLQDALRQSPAVLHFIGHGQYDQDSQKALLWFTDRDEHAEALSGDWLATLLRGTSVRFVFLNACESGRAGGGLASVLVKRGIPAVLGMQNAVVDEVAIALAGGFYKALRDGYAVDAALVEGRKAIVNALGNEPDKADWTYPVLYMRAPDGRLFE